MKIKSIIATALTAVVLSATSASAIIVTVDEIDQAALSSFTASQSVVIGNGGAFTEDRETPTSSDTPWRSPWDTDDDGHTDTAFFTVGTSGSANDPFSALLVFETVQSSLTFLWGSVDDYNLLTFRDSDGNTVDTVTGSQVLALGAPDGSSAARVIISSIVGGFSQILFSSTSNAFEFSNIQTVSSNIGVPEVPIPAALPLFGTGLALMGFLGWRRKRKAA